MRHFFIFFSEKTIPIATIVAMGIASLCLKFNGLYGQDAHEYLRQSRAIFERMQGAGVGVAELGDARFAGAYPFFGAMLRRVLPDSILAMQVVSWLSAGLAVHFFLANLRFFTPGAMATSRYLAATWLVLTPLFVRSGLTSMSDLLALACMLGAVRYGAEAAETGRGRAGVAAAAWAGMAVGVRFAMLGVMIPLVIFVAGQLFQKRRWAWLLAAVVAGLVGLMPHFWVKMPLVGPYAHGLQLQDWSVWNLFSRHFATVGEGAQGYFLPNGLYALSVLAHPALGVGLLLMAPLFRRTDLQIWPKRILLTCLVAYLLLIGGLAMQSIRFLLPAWALVLILAFPTFDRMVSYGLYFVPRITRVVLLVGLVVQFVLCGVYLRPVLTRHAEERRLADSLRPHLPSYATLYAFDADVALRTYLPDVQMRNLWAMRYPSFEAGSFVLWHETRFGQQWAGQNPVLNWQQAQQQPLRVVAQLPDGWTLWNVRSER
jgi:hypothetical protein